MGIRACGQQISTSVLPVVICGFQIKLHLKSLSIHQLEGRIYTALRREVMNEVYSYTYRLTPIRFAARIILVAATTYWSPAATDFPLASSTLRPSFEREIPSSRFPSKKPKKKNKQKTTRQPKMNCERTGGRWESVISSVLE